MQEMVKNKILVNKKIGLAVPEVLLPNKTVDMSKWAVVACDQFTSQPEYWQEVETIVGDTPSTNNVIFPEVFLEKPGEEERIEKINASMNKYLEEGTLVKQAPGFIYLDRSTEHTPSRKGLVIGLDLEQYSYEKGSKTLVRATEGTIPDRIPPRLKVRKNASIELPHILVLIDDPEKTVIEPIAARTSQLEKVYDTDLMMKGGHIKGWKVEEPAMIQNIFTALEKLSEINVFQTKYNTTDTDVLLFATGDGNHSLATAKAHWGNIKKTLTAEEQESHPARYALVELNNIHDEGLVFEPIYRVVFNVSPKQFVTDFVTYCNNLGLNAEWKETSSKTEALKIAETVSKGVHAVPFASKTTCGTVLINKPNQVLEVGTLQVFINDYLKTNTNAEVDYIHGTDIVDDLAAKDNNIGLYTPTVDKNTLFETVVKDGSLPRKTFSMGEAEEKRYYLESKKIV